MLTKSLIETANAKHISFLKQLIYDLESFDSYKIVKGKIPVGNDERSSDSIKKLGLKKSRGIYLIFTKGTKVDKVKKALSDYRLSIRSESYGDKEAVPKPNSNAKARNGCIYVGMTRKNSLEHRLIQHFIGTGKTNRTTALKLHLWASPIKELDVYCLVFDGENYQLIREYEKALWRYYQPAIGEL